MPNKVAKDGKFIYFDISSVNNKTGEYSIENILDVNDAPSRARREIKENDVLLSTVRPNLKAFALLSNIPKNSIASTGFAVLRCKEKVLPKYVYESLFTDFMQNQMIGKMGKGAYPSINQTDVENLEIPLPPISVQQEIVKRIEDEQALVNSNKKLVEIFEQKIKDEINKLWQAAPKDYAMSEGIMTLAAEE
ncbi:MAG: restriction endonuclease subunit S [Saprospiraceae bacterium]|nr:restriction endonuclease subunit S [Saprospiraceae bacterium]